MEIDKRILKYFLFVFHSSLFFLVFLYFVVIHVVIVKNSSENLQPSAQEE